MVGYRKCNMCGLEKPLDEFYARSNGKLYSICKSCHRQKSALLAKRRLERGGKPESSQSGELGELMVMRLLHAHGIPAIRTIGDYTDVLAYGIVRIEVKSASVRGKGNYNFGFGDDQRENFHAHVIALVCIDIPTFHFFHADDPVFFWQNGNGIDRRSGERKSGVGFTVRPHRSYNRSGNSTMTANVMMNHMLRFDILEAARDKACAELKAQTSLEFPILTKFPSGSQTSMF